MNRKVVSTPVDRLRLRNSRSGISGSAVRDSIATKAPSRPRPSTAVVSTVGEVQPEAGPWTRVKTTRVAPAVAVSAPGRSNEREASRGPSAPISRGASRAAPPASGTLT